MHATNTAGPLPSPWGHEAPHYATYSTLTQCHAAPRHPTPCRVPLQCLTSLAGARTCLHSVTMAQLFSPRAELLYLYNGDAGYKDCSPLGNYYQCQRVTRAPP